MVTYSRRTYSRRSYRRSGFSKGRRSSTFSSPLKASKVRSQVAGTDLAKFACKIPGKVVLAPRVQAFASGNQTSLDDVLGTVVGQINVFEALSSSEYFSTLRKLYDEVRLNSCSVKVFMDKSEGTLNVSSPSFLYKAAWDRNGLTVPAIPVDFASRWDTYNRIPVASQYASCVTRSGNFYSAFSSTHSWTASSMGEKQQFISTRHMKDIGLIGLDVDGSDISAGFGAVGSVYRQRFRGLYDDQGMYSSAAAKPTLLIQLESSTVRTASMTFELNCDLTCRGVKVLDGSQFSEKIVNVKANQVQRGVAFKNSDDEVEVGDMVVVENEPIKTVGPLGGPIQIGIPGVKYDGSCTIDMSWDPPGDDPGTYVTVSKAHFFSQKANVDDGFNALYTGSFHKVSNDIHVHRIMAILYIPKDHEEGINDAFVCLVIAPVSSVGSRTIPETLTSIPSSAYNVYVCGFNLAEWPDSARFIYFYSDNLDTTEVRTTPYLFNSIQITTDGTAVTRLKAFNFFNPSIIDYTASLTDEPQP